MTLTRRIGVGWGYGLGREFRGEVKNCWVGVWITSCNLGFTFLFCHTTLQMEIKWCEFA